MKIIRNRRCYIFGLLLFGASISARAQKITVHFEPSQADIRWKLGGSLHSTHGSFKLKGGLMTFDAQTGVAEGEILVDAESGESGNTGRDTKMRAEVLETQRYPQIFFHPTKVTGQLKPGTTQDIAVEGTFNIHGADHPLVLKVEAQLEAKSLTAKTSFVVPYVQWGMKDPSSGLMRVRKEVEVDVVAHGSVDTTP